MFFRLNNSGNGVVWDVEPFGVHFVVFDLVGADRKESAEADMECEVRDDDTFLLEAV